MALNAHDRCDADCPAQALTRVINVHLHVLQFCGHHLNRYSEGLDAQGFTTVATTTEELEPA